MDRKISIVLPVYNMERFLERCLKSVVSQSYSNLELIAVDDGSTDSSLMILEKWKQNDPRIIVISQENKGLSEARNTGMKNASGDYLIFIDSDDYIEADALSRLLEADAHDADLIISAGAYHDISSKNVTIFKPIKLDTNRRYTGYEFLYESIKQHSPVNVVWLYMFSMKAILKNNLSFTGRYHEDERWTPKFISTLNYCYFVDYCFYHYVENPTSLSKVKKKYEKDMALVNNIEYLCGEVVKNAPNKVMRDTFATYYVKMLIILDASSREYSLTPQVRSVVKILAKHMRWYSVGKILVYTHFLLPRLLRQLIKLVRREAR